MQKRLDEARMCGTSREAIRKFLKMSKEERGSMHNEEKIQTALAFQHIERCCQRYNMPDLCNKLWEELRTMTWKKDKNGDRNAKYDPEVERYMLFARFPAHDIEGTGDNPLKKLYW